MFNQLPRRAVLVGTCALLSTDLCPRTVLGQVIPEPVADGPDFFGPELPPDRLPEGTHPALEQNRATQILTGGTPNKAD
jgi:hypothetical protein